MLFSHCERLKRFYIVDSLKGQSPSEVTKPRSSNNAALYYPWIYILHDRQKCLVPPGGYIAGIYSRADITRGVHNAPANEVANGAVDLEFAVSRSQRDSLNPLGVNCICYFEGMGILVWGARTLSSDPEFKYVNVKRFLIYVEQSIKLGTAWVVFEPDTEATWAKVQMQVENFLNMAWQTGMLMGVKSQEAYFVHCDRTTMTQNDIDNGNLNILFGVAVVKPAEFLIVRVNQKTHQ
jgi:phage tail sheath protein FI